MAAFFVKLIEFQLKLLSYATLIVGMLVSIAKLGVDLVTELTTWAFGEIASFQSPDLEFGITDAQNILALANHFFPLAELWALLVVSVPFMLFIVILRFIKSWIPTIAN